MLSDEVRKVDAWPVPRATLVICLPSPHHRSRSENVGVNRLASCDSFNAFTATGLSSDAVLEVQVEAIELSMGAMPPLRRADDKRKCRERLSKKKSIYHG